MVGSGPFDRGTRFDAVERRTFESRALAVLRPTGPGKIRLLASAPECDPVEILIAVA